MMARPLRIEYPGAIYHVTARGNARAAIFLGDDDRRLFLTLFAEVIERYGWACYAYCLMDNHYHLLVETPAANLGRGMRQLNGIYTQRFNRAHGRVGHVFQGRYKAILVEKRAYLLELCRYTVLNPVRAGMTASPGDWVWSSYRETAGARVAKRDAIVPVSRGWVWRQFDSEDRAAKTAYRRFVRAGVRTPARPWDGLRAGLVLGGDRFVASLRPYSAGVSAEAPKPQRHLTRPPLAELAGTGGNRGAWMTEAHDGHGYTLAQIADAAGLHYSSVSKIIKAWRKKASS